MKKVKWIITILTVTIFLGCTQPERMAYTPSGRPQVTINSTDIELVKSTIINETQVKASLN
jgi:hypothetical protein